jgi:putative membrane protein
MAEPLRSTAELILRDHLALDRTRLANERTLLAYVRTAFMLVAAGVTALKLFVDTPSVVMTSWAFIGLGAFVLIFGVWRFVAMRHLINGRVYRPEMHPPNSTLAREVP